MELNEAAEMLGALAQSSRLQVFRLLVSSERMCAGELAEHLEVPKPTLSFHLKELSRVGLLGSEREGRLIYYRLKEDGFRDLMGFLAEDCCQGRPELCLPRSLEGAVSSCC